VSEWPGATIPAKCHDCGRTYFVSKPENDTPDAVCKDCWDAFDGCTIEELAGESAATVTASAGGKP
jgi:hypothetical protein